MTKFKATYSEEFSEKAFVEKTIYDWVDGAPSFVLQSSGSTGTAKNIALSRALLTWSAESTKEALKLGDKSQNLLCCLPVTKTGGFMQLIRALHFGWHIHFENPAANPLEKLLSESAYSQVSFTPMQLENVLSNNRDSLAQFKHILIGGAAISEELHSKIMAYVTENETHFWETYGMTETASHIALRKISIDRLFKPQPGVEVEAINGLLQIAIPALDLKLQTTDMVQIHVDGFEILGRADFIINSGGLKINPLEIEPKVKDLLVKNGINNAFYLGKKADTLLGEKMVLIIEEDPNIVSANVLDMLKSILPNHQSPKEIHIVPSLTHTDTGKVIRKPI